MPVVGLVFDCWRVFGGPFACFGGGCAGLIAGGLVGVFWGVLAVLIVFLYTLGMSNATHTPKRLTRKQVNEGLDQFPIAGLLGGSSRELTAKQKAFAREVALGSTGAGAYRKVYSDKGSARTAGNNASKIKSNTGISLEIEAIKRAQEAEHIKNPLALRSLVIQTLVEVASNPDAKHSDRLAAVKILGGVTEVAAFSERKETKIIISSTDARAQILAELRLLANAHASDAKVIDSQASELLDELKTSNPEPHPAPIPQTSEQESRGFLHTIPLEQFPKNSNNQNINSTPQPPPHPFREDPPV